MTRPAWTKSSSCDSGYCVEAALGGDLILVRDSRYTGERDTVLTFTPPEWLDLLASVRADEAPQFGWRDDRIVMLSHRAHRGGTGALPFTYCEWAEFTRGVKAGEFDLDVLAAAADGAAKVPAGPLLPDEVEVGAEPAT